MWRVKKVNKHIQKNCASRWSFYKNVYLSCCSLLRNMFNYCCVSETPLIILLFFSRNTLIHPVAAFWEHVQLSSLFVSESHLRVGSWPSVTSQVYWHRRWPSQFNERLLFLSYRLAYVEETSRCEDKGKVHRHERLRGRPNSCVAAQVMSHLLCFWVYW